MRCQRRRRSEGTNWSAPSTRKTTRPDDVHDDGDRRVEEAGVRGGDLAPAVSSPAGMPPPAIGTRLRAMSPVGASHSVRDGRRGERSGHVPMLLTAAVSPHRPQSPSRLGRSADPGKTRRGAGYAGAVTDPDDPKNGASPPRASPSGSSCRRSASIWWFRASSPPSRTGADGLTSASTGACFGAASERPIRNLTMSMGRVLQCWPPPEFPVGVGRAERMTGHDRTALERRGGREVEAAAPSVRPDTRGACPPSARRAERADPHHRAGPSPLAVAHRGGEPG